MASEFHVQAGESIQDTINKASSGDVILVESGKFNESIHVNKDNLTIKSTSGNPDHTTIAGESVGSYVFEIIASNVSISGFSITEGRCGIFLNKVQNCTISNNKISNQEVGIYLFESDSNFLSDNMLYANLDCGLKMLASPNNIICGNYFNNANNARDNKFNTWNDTKGNYWSDYNGTDENEDGIGDIAYAVNPKTGSTDYMPLMKYPPAPPVLPRASFTSDVTEGLAPLSVGFKDLSENITSRLWEFGDGNTSSNPNPLHTYFSEGSYVVSLAVSNENGSDSASIIVEVLNASEQSGPILPKAEFISNTTSGHVPLVVKFVDISKNADCVKWSFGDGKTSYCLEPVHTFCCPGNYTVSLTAENENGTSSTCVVITVESNETYKGAEKGTEGQEVISSNENAGNLVNSISSYASDTSGKLLANDAPNSEVAEDSEADKGNNGVGSLRTIRGQDIESIKNSVISAASSKVLSGTDLSLENEILKVQNDVEEFVDNSLSGAEDSLSEIEKRAAPWIPSFLGLAGVVFMVTMLKRRRRI